jgi:hypothetical protein
MNKRLVLPAFTLVEVLASVVIFTGVVGLLFSALSAMQRTDLFRRDNRAVAQAADLAFEPLVQSIKNASAKETVRTPSGCVTVQGFYTTTNAGTLPNQNILDGTQATFSNENGRLVVISADKDFDAQIGETQKWMRRDYFVRKNSRGNLALVEKTYQATTPYAWPNPLRSNPDSCEAFTEHWQPSVVTGSATEVEKELTSPDVTVSNFSVGFVAATVPSAGSTGDAAITQHAPYITLSLTISKPTSKVAQPVTLRTTLTPTFSYGETRDN